MGPPSALACTLLLYRPCVLLVFRWMPAVGRCLGSFLYWRFSNLRLAAWAAKKLKWATSLAEMGRFSDMPFFFDRLRLGGILCHPVHKKQRLGAQQGLLFERPSPGRRPEDGPFLALGRHQGSGSSKNSTYT